MQTVKFKRLHDRARIPDRAYESAAGYDLYPCDDGFLLPGVHTIVRLGFATEFEPGYGAFVFDRGGMGAKGITHFAGVIDADYRGEWMVVLFNSTNQTVYYEYNKAIAQVVFLPVQVPGFMEVDSLSESLRGGNRCGSSDKGGRVYDVNLGFSAQGGVSGDDP